MSSQIQDALGMFAFLAVELSVLFIGISLLVGVLQRHIPASKIETLLSSSHGRGYLIAAGLGAITPFCSCSTIPMLKGLIRAGAGFGPMMVFLFSSPLLNPIVVVLLVATFGWTLTVIYVCAAFLVSVVAGWLLHRLGFERYLLGQGSQPATGCSAASCVASGGAACIPVPVSKYKGLWQEAWSDFVNVVPYLFIGIAIGSMIYGFMPMGLLERYAGPENAFAIPVAAVIGVPLYIRATAVIPLAGALLAKGVGAGAVLALIIGSAGASLAELILLRSLFSLRLLAAFVAVIFSMALIAGYATFLFF